MNGAKRVGDTMPTYKDLVELAQICLGQARTARNSEASAALYQLEAVLKLDQALQSFRSMRRMEASFKKARALRLRFSQSLARRRQRLSHAMVRSTIQRLGNRTNPVAWSDRLTISVSRSGRILTSAFAKIGP